MPKTVETLKGEILDDLGLLDKERAKLNAELERLDNETQLLRKMLAYIDDKSTSEELDSVTPRPPINLEGTRSHRERLQRMALANGGLVGYAEAANILIAYGYSKGKKGNVQTSAFRLMNDSNDWVKEKPGVFRYIGEDQVA